MQEKQNHWLFVLTEYSDYNLGSYQNSLQQIKNKLQWPIGKFTQNRKRMKKGDLAIVYISGSKNQFFIANLMIDSEVQKNADKMFGYIKIKYLKIWEKKILLLPLLNCLKFITNKKRYYWHFRAGVRSIPESDFFLLMSLART